MELTRDAIFAVNDIKVEGPIEIPEWNGSVHVKMMTGAERDKLEATTVSRKAKTVEINMSNFRARVVAATVCNSKGDLLFSDDDVKALGSKGAAPIDRVYEVAAKLNRITKQDAEELTKNSESAQND